MACSTQSNDGDVSGNNGNVDMWVVKLDPQGNIQWQKCLGGTSDDIIMSTEQTTDGSYILTGRTISNNGDVLRNNGSYDAWIVKLDPQGSIQWQKCLGGTNWDQANSIQQTTDGGYVVAGATMSNDSDVSGNHGYSDMWVVKIDPYGNIQWQKCLGGTNDEEVLSISQTTDGGYIMAGYTNSNDGDVSGNNGDVDMWIIKTNPQGDIQWQKCLGGTSNEIAYSIQQITDGGYILAGYTESNDGDVSGNNGMTDMWVVKLTETNNIFPLENLTSELSCLPNPAHERVLINLPVFTRKVEVFNLSGELVQQQLPQKQVAEINVKELAKGIYVVKMYSGKGVVTSKFIKQ